MTRRYTKALMAFVVLLGNWTPLHLHTVPGECRFNPFSPLPRPAMLVQALQDAHGTRRLARLERHKQAGAAETWGRSAMKTAWQKNATRTPATDHPKAKAAIPDPVLIDAQSYKDLLARHRGKAVMVNFWATWCEPCREEYPMVNELARRYASQGLVVLGISLDDDAEMNLVRRFLARTNPVFPNYRKKPGDEEQFINAVNRAWSGAIPATFFYNRDGRRFAQLVGTHKREEFEKAIQDLLRQPAPR